jgi:hypothetical protein
VVDLAIASNFARELTENQFAEERRRGRRGAPASRGANAAETTVRRSDRAQARRQQDTSSRRSAGFGISRLGRTLARLAQVRG